MVTKDEDGKSTCKRPGSRPPSPSTPTRPQLTTVRKFFTKKRKKKPLCGTQLGGQSFAYVRFAIRAPKPTRRHPPDARRGTLTRPRESMRSALTRLLTPPRLPVRTRVPFCTRADSCPYAVLDLPNDATEEQVQAAYRSLAKRCSPMPRMPSTPTPMTHARERSAPWQVAPRHAVGLRGPLSGDPVSSR